MKSITILEENEKKYIENRVKQIRDATAKGMDLESFKINIIHEYAEDILELLDCGVMRM